MKTKRGPAASRTAGYLASESNISPPSALSGSVHAAAAMAALKKAHIAGGGMMRQAFLAEAQKQIAALDSKQCGELVQSLQDCVVSLGGRPMEETLAHVKPGEIVVPAQLRTPELIAALQAAAEVQGIDLSRYLVGNRRNSINPRTGQPEFQDHEDNLGTPSQAGSTLGSDTQPIEEITVTTPRETGVVQLPQDIPNEFRIYGKPGNGQAQYGVPAAMEVVGAASHAWQQTGNAPFNVGNMSKSDLSPYSRRSEASDHSKGTGIDIRPVRIDGQNLPISYGKPGCDTLRATGGVQTIYFNDPEIRGVTYQDMHDDHLHVRVNPNYRRPPGK